MSRLSPVRSAAWLRKETYSVKQMLIEVLESSSSKRTMNPRWCGRIILGQGRGTPGVPFAPGKQKTGLICPQGQVEIAAEAPAALAQFAAGVGNLHRRQIARHAGVKHDNALHFMAGAAATTRDLNILLGKLGAALPDSPFPGRETGRPGLLTRRRHAGRNACLASHAASRFGFRRVDIEGSIPRRSVPRVRMPSWPG